MSIAVHDGHDLRVAGPERSHDLHILRTRTAHAAKTLLMQGLRMLLVVGCFTALTAAVIGIKLYAFLPPLHH